MRLTEPKLFQKNNFFYGNPIGIFVLFLNGEYFVLDGNVTKLVFFVHFVVYDRDCGQ